MQQANIGRRIDPEVMGLTFLNMRNDAKLEKLIVRHKLTPSEAAFCRTIRDHKSPLLHEITAEMMSANKLNGCNSFNWVSKEDRDAAAACLLSE